MSADESDQIKSNKNYHLQTFLAKCKYKIKEKKVKSFINDDLESFSEEEDLEKNSEQFLMTF